MIKNLNLRAAAETPFLLSFINNIAFSYEKENAGQKRENGLLLEKVNTLIAINQDLIKARQEDLEQKAAEESQPKVVMEVRAKGAWYSNFIFF